MSGHFKFNLNLFDRYPSTIVDTVVATEENFAPYGRFVHDFEAEDIWITPWPVSGNRPLAPGTGRGGGVVSGLFHHWERNNILYSRNDAVASDEYDSQYEIGMRLGRRVYTCEANYHPDGGQCFHPHEGRKPFTLLLALPSEDVKASDFKAFRFDGTVGAQIKPGVWHQPPFAHEDTVMIGKQGAVHACVVYNSIDEERCMIAFDL